MPHSVWYNAVEGRRTYVSVYFEDAKSPRRSKGDITLAFGSDDSLYEKARALGSSGIKRIIGIDSYHALLEAAKKERRPLGNFIKHRLSIYFEDEKDNPSS